MTNKHSENKSLENIDSVDLSDEFPSSSAPVTQPLPKIDPEQKREDVRGVLALVVLGFIVAIPIIFISMFIWANTPLENIKELAILLYQPLLGIAGTVFGFYFGATKSRI